MKFQSLLVLYLLSINIAVHAGTYDQPTSLGAQWLASQQNADGSWGATPDVQPVYTSAAVRALASAYKLQYAYFAGVTWLESHDSDNVDLIARQVDSLIDHGDDLSPAQAYLQTAQAYSGTTYAGWGLSSYYTSSTIDTALALIAYADLGGGLQIQPALNFLKSSQLTGANNQGWAVNNAVSSDPAITALVIQALARYTAQDATLVPIISYGLSTLNALVTLTTPTAIQALSAQAAQAAGNSALTTTFLSMLTTSQATTGVSKGSWNADLYTSALATSALASAANASSLSAPVVIPDQALRQAINLELGRNSMDNLSQGQLLQLTSLTAVGAGISDLTGLQLATNLATINLENNNLTDITPLSKLGASISWAGNPGSSGGSTQVPAVPPLGQLLMALGLFGIMTYLRRTSISKGVF
jgi:hypothetical protein